MTIPGAHLLEGLIDPADLRQLGIPENPNIVGLFAGYGGLEQGIIAALGGGQVIAYSEFSPPKWNEKRQRFERTDQSAAKLLSILHPDIPNLGDITLIDWAPWVGLVHIMCGGFPCQDVSHAGLGKGLQVGTRSGLWYEFARAIFETRPEFVIIENVKGLRSAPAGMKEEVIDEETVDSDVRSDDGDLVEPEWGDRPVLRAFGAVQGDLASMGYVSVWGSVRAADVGAPHGRERVFIIAWPDRR